MYIRILEFDPVIQDGDDPGQRIVYDTFRFRVVLLCIGIAPVGHILDIERKDMFAFLPEKMEMNSEVDPLPLFGTALGYDSCEKDGCDDEVCCFHDIWVFKFDFMFRV